MKHFITGAVLLFPLLTFAQPDTLWTRRHRVSIQTGAETVDGQFIMLGAYASNCPIHMHRFDQDGAWIEEIALDSSFDWLATSVHRVDSSDYLVATSSELLRLRDNGSVVWSVHRYSSYPYDWYIPGKHALIIDQENQIVIGGKMSHPPPYYGSEAYLERMALTSETIWSHGYQAWFAVVAICPLTGGGYAAITTTVTQDAVAGFQNNGSLQWQRTLGPSLGSMYRRDDRAIVAQPDGGCIAGHMLPDTGVGVYSVRRFSAIGDSLWTQQLPGFVRGGGTISMFAEPQGGCVIFGFGTPLGTPDLDLYMLALSEEGDILWSQTCGTEYDDFLKDVCRTSDGGYLCISNFQETPIDTVDLFLVRLSADMNAPIYDVIVPELFALFAYPNPFNPTTTLSFSLPHASEIALVVYDMTGRQVQTLADGRWNAGEHSITFNGADLPSGLYFARLTAGDFTQTQKLVLLK